MAESSVLRDLWNHHAWADAEHWRSFAAFPGALEDKSLLERLHHLHLTQSAWVWAIGDRRDEFVFSKTSDFVPIFSLRDFAIRNHEALAVLSAADEPALDRDIENGDSSHPVRPTPLLSFLWIALCLILSVNIGIDHAGSRTSALTASACRRSSRFASASPTRPSRTGCARRATALMWKCGWTIADRDGILLQA